MSTRLRASGLLAALAAVGLVALVSALLLAVGARSASQPQGLIAFTRDGADAVYVMHPDGSDIRLLWQGKRGVADLAWSPDGSRLAVSTAGRSIWVVNADGSDPVRVARVGARSLSWSADGGRIAFTSRDDIWLMNADGSHMRRLKRTPELPEHNVDWSPVGGRIAFDTGGWVSQLYVIRTNGRNLQVVQSGKFWDAREPDWSPDGRRLAFSAPPTGTGEADSGEIWVMNANGTSPVRLTRNDVYEGSPVWSPDGQRIVFVREPSDTPLVSEIWVMNADGTREKRLTTGASPAWQPTAVP